MEEGAPEDAALLAQEPRHDVAQVALWGVWEFVWGDVLVGVCVCVH